MIANRNEQTCSTVLREKVYDEHLIATVCDCGKRSDGTYGFRMHAVCAASRCIFIDRNAETALLHVRAFCGYSLYSQIMEVLPPRKYFHGQIVSSVVGYEGRH